MSGAEVVVLLGSRFAALEEHGTRWRAVLRHWAGDPRIGRLTAVDFPRFGVRSSVQDQSSWLAGCRSLSLTVPGRRTTGPLDALGWRLAARSLQARLGRATGPQVVVAATPLSAPLLTHVNADRCCFDAVDDWRVLPSMAAVRDRVDAGYRAAARADTATAVSPVFADRLRQDYGLHAQVVANGVEVGAYLSPGAAPDGLPKGPFAVYVGVVQERVDLALLQAATAVMPVVVAGPVAVGDRLPEVTWLGPQHVDLLPGLLSRAAVGLLPHHVDALTASMDPMKLQEYRAAGLPVVATSLPGLVASDRLLLADDPDAFARAVTTAATRPHAPQPVRDWAVVADELLTRFLGAA